MIQVKTSVRTHVQLYIYITYIYIICIYTYRHTQTHTETLKIVHVHRLIHIHISQLCLLEGSSSSDTSIAMSASSTQILVSEFHQKSFSNNKNQCSLKKRLILALALYKTSPEQHSYFLARKYGSAQKSKGWGHIKDKQEPT